jgi:hypothetical protein
MKKLSNKKANQFLIGLFLYITSMKEIFSSVIRRKVIRLINDIGLGVSEIIIDLPLSFDTFNTIELSNNLIILHKFNDVLDYTTDFDDLDDEDKLEVYKFLYLYL